MTDINIKINSEQNRKEYVDFNKLDKGSYLIEHESTRDKKIVTVTHDSIIFFYNTIQSYPKNFVLGFSNYFMIGKLKTLNVEGILK